MEEEALLLLEEEALLLFEEDAELLEGFEEDSLEEESGSFGSMMVMPELVFFHCATAVTLSEMETWVPAARTP